MCTNIMFASVEEQLLFRFLEKAMPTWEKRRSTEAEMMLGNPPTNS